MQVYGGFVDSSVVGDACPAAIAEGVPPVLVAEVSFKASFHRVASVDTSILDATAGAAADDRCSDGRTFLHLLLEFLPSHGGMERVTALLGRGATPDLVDRAGETALHVVLRKACAATRRKYPRAARTEHHESSTMSCGSATFGTR